MRLLSSIAGSVLMIERDEGAIPTLHESPSSFVELYESYGSCTFIFVVKDTQKLMTAGASPTDKNGKPRETRTGIAPPPLHWWSQLSTSDKIGFLVLIVAIVALIVAVATLVYTTKQLALAVKGTQYQNAILIIDQSSDLADRLRKQPRLLEVLENKTSDSASIEMTENNLEIYQSLLFKAAVLEENELMPAEFWSAFLDDFCSRLYNKYPYIQGWWGRQKVREPYASLSKRYRDLSFECVGHSSGKGSAP